MKRYAFLLMILAFATFAWEFVGPEGDWLSATWLPRGELLLTGPNYRGLFIYYDEDRLDTVTLDWKAGYRPALNDNLEALVFTGNTNFDSPGRVQVYNLLHLTLDEIYSGQKVGPPVFNENGHVVFSDEKTVFVYSLRGVLVDMFLGGANVILPIADGDYFFCDRAGIAYHYKPQTDKLEAIALTGGGRFTFSPVASRDGKWVAFEDIGGAVFLYDVLSRKVTELPKGDVPIFIDEPFGVLQIQLEDDGEDITSSKIVFVAIEDGEIAYVKDVLESAWKHLVTHIDFRPGFGLLLTTRDGRIIHERDYEEVLSK